MSAGDSDGNEVRNYADGPVRIAPLATVSYVVSQRDNTGGSGANFIIEWDAERAVDAPVIESVMIGVQGNQSFSFKTEGRVLAEAK